MKPFKFTDPAVLWNAIQMLRFLEFGALSVLPKESRLVKEHLTEYLFAPAVEGYQSVFLSKRKRKS